MANIIKGFEGLSEEGKISLMEGILAGESFHLDKRLGRCGLENHFYSKEGADGVFCSITGGRSNQAMISVMDRDTYESHFRGTEAKDSRVLCPKERNNRDFKVVCHSGGCNNMTLHHMVTGCLESGQAVDHMTHHLGINIRDYIRVCSPQENNFNKKYYSKVSDDGLSFSMPDKTSSADERKALKNKGYTISGGRLCSPKFSTKAEMYAELNRLEGVYLKEFRYNPLIDFKETWYAFVLCKVLGIISEEEMKAYNRIYHVSRDSKLADYYQI